MVNLTSISLDSEIIKTLREVRYSEGVPIEAKGSWNNFFKWLFEYLGELESRANSKENIEESPNA